MTKRPKLRTRENADRICELLGEGHTLRQIARELGCEPRPSRTGCERIKMRAAPSLNRYARAREVGFGMMADEMIAISDADYTGPDGM